MAEQDTINDITGGASVLENLITLIGQHPSPLQLGAGIFSLFTGFFSFIHPAVKAAATSKAPTAKVGVSS